MKKKINHIDDDLLIRYLADETTKAENTVVQQWLAESETNRSHAEGYRILLEESKALRPQGFGDADLGWNRFKERIESKEQLLPAAYPFKKWMSIAAGIMMVLSFAAWFFLREQAAVNLTANDQPLVDTLSDGSLVSLRNHSSLKYRAGQVREVDLKGEAFFEVKHDAGHPFRIQVSDLTINVLGTAFNVKNTGDQTEISVLRGIVGISGGNQNIKLLAGEKLIAVSGQRWQKQAKTDFNLNHYPGLIRALLKDPNKWPELLKPYTPPDTSQTARNKALVRAIIQQLVNEGIVNDAGSVQAFHLNSTGFIVNGVLEPDAVFRRYKTQYLPSDDFTIAFGAFDNEPIKRKGVFVKRSTL